MARFEDIVTGLARQTSRKHNELTRDLEELDTLRTSWQRFQELSKQVDSKQRMVKIGYALLLSAPVRVKVDADAFAPPSDKELKDQAQGLGLALNADELDLSNFPLWKVIREVVRQTAEIRVYELEAHLKQFGLKKATRPAIESALSTHPKEFRVVKRGREKFVSLK
jgi:hypothetical protein